MSLTVTIAGTVYQILEKSLKIPDKIDQRSTCSFSLVDSTGTLLFQKRQPVSVDDSIQGNLFTGYVNQPSSQKLYPNAHIMWTLQCVDQTSLLDKRTSNKIYNNQYAGTVVADQIQRHGNAEGITGAFALRWDELETDWAAGTLTNTVATTNASDGNVGDGDLELSLAGTPISISESGSTFSTGTLSGVQVTGGNLTQIPFNTVKIVGTNELTNAGNTFTYVKIWSGSYTVPAAPNSGFLIYDLYVLASSPEIKIGLDFVCSDGTTWRDNATEFDQQSMPPHPKTDLSGLANGQWYHREFGIQDFAGKTISYVSIVLEGDKTGEYTGYVRNAFIANSSRVSVQDIFRDSTTSLNTNQQLQNYGYTNVLVNVAKCYDSSDFRIVSYSIDAAKISASTYIAWRSTQTAPIGTTSATVAQNPGSYVEVKYSLDGGNSAHLCQNGAPFPDFPAGLSVAGKSIEFIQLLVSGTPEDSPVLTQFTFSLTPAINGTTADVLDFRDSNTTWSAGTFSNTTNNSSPTLSLSGAIRNWDNADSSNQPLYGSSNPAIFTSNKTLALGTDSGTDVRCRMDFAPQLQNFTAEIDTLVTSNTNTGFVYRTTNWGNSNDSYGYTVTVTTNQLLLAHGNNSTGAGSFTSIQSVTLSLANNQWHRLKLVINGTSHKVYLDDVLIINATDSTYNFAGYIGLRNYVGVSVGVHTTGYFDNFGIVPVLSGTWTSPSISLNALGTYLNSDFYCGDVSTDHNNCTISADYTINGGSTWVNIFTVVATSAPYSFSGPLPGLTVGQSFSGVSIQYRFTLTTTTATAQPQVNSVVLKILGGFSASGTRVSPALSLSPVGRAGTALVNWNDTIPTNTTVLIETSLNNGVSWQTVSMAGGAISGINTQPAPVVDTFAVDDHTSYTQSNFGGSNGTWTWDTANSRLVGSGGSNATVVANTALTGADNQILFDLDQADNAGPIANYQNSSNFYFVRIWDASGTTQQNKVQLFKRSGGTNTQLGSTVSITFTRGTYRRFILDVQAGVITVSMDGVQLIQQTDGSPLAAGQYGLFQNTLIRCYTLRAQQYGDDVSSKTLKTRVTLTSTDPTATPQLLDMQAFVSNPSIGPGVLLVNKDYRRTYVSANIDDANTESNYWWYVKSDKSTVFQDRDAVPAPWVLASANSQQIAGQQIGDVLIQNLKLDNSGDLYRNRQIERNAIDTETFVEIKTGDGQTRTWNVANPITSPPALSLNGQMVTIGVNGVDSGKQFYYQLGSTAITQDNSQTILQKDLDQLTITYTGSVLVDVVVDNTSIPGTITQSMMAAIDGSSGIVEAVEDVSSLNLTVAAATTRADQFLTRYGNIGRTLTFQTLHTGLQPGQQLTCFVPEHNLVDAQLLITSVDISVVTIAGGILQYWYSVVVTEGPNLGSWVKLLASALGG